MTEHRPPSRWARLAPGRARLPRTFAQGRRRRRGHGPSPKMEIAVAVALVLLVLGLGRYHALATAARSAAAPLLAMLPRAIVPARFLPAAAAARSPIDYGLIDRRLKLLAVRADMVGLGVVIVEDGAIRFARGYGTTEAGPDGRGAGDAVTPDTVFRWASVSKGVASTMVAALAAEGRLSLDAPVADYAATLRLPGGTEKQATVTDLLSQRLGIAKNAYDDKLEENVDPRVIRAHLSQLDRVCAPGTCWTYQNVAYDAASEIVGRVTGESYDAAVRRRLFGPLGMTSASTTREGLMAARSWAKPHVGRRTLDVKEAYYRVPAAGGVNSSVRDLGLWMMAQMGVAPSVLSPAVLWTVHLPRVFTTTPRSRMADHDRAMEHPTYALGWRDAVYSGHRLIGHRGAVSGYRSLILFDPERRTGIAMLWNSQSAKPSGLPLELFDMLYGNPRHDWLDLGGDRADE